MFIFMFYMMQLHNISIGNAESDALKFEWCVQHPNGMWGDNKGGKGNLGVEGCFKSLLHAVNKVSGVVPLHRSSV